jgi:integrase
VSRTARLDLATIAARRRLKPSAKPHWTAIAAGLHLGVHVAGDITWRARRRTGSAYEERSIGLCEMTNRLADGDGVLSFDQAAARARAWKAEREATPTIPPPTVREAIEAYLADRKGTARERDARLKLEKHIPHDDPLAGIALDQMTVKDLKAWRKRRLTALAPATQNRVKAGLRAALNETIRHHRERLPPGIADVIRDGLRALPDADRPREVEILADADVRRVVEAADSHDADFGTLVAVLAATGARLSQVVRCRVVDLQVRERRLLIPTSAKGRGTKTRTVTPVPLGDDMIARLERIAAGRPGHEPLLMHWHHVQVSNTGRPKWERAGRVAWKSSAEMTRPWQELIKAVGLPAGTVPYVLRHSSIVRGLRANLPIRLVAQLHDTSVTMIERVYSAFLVDVSEDLARRALVDLGSASVTRLHVVAG